MYYLSLTAGRKKGWAYEREAFRCFNPDFQPPPRTRPLHRLWNAKHARFWAVPGSPEYEDATLRGFNEPPQNRGPLCYIW